MATAWPSTVRADWDPDKGVRTGRVAQLPTRDLVLAQHALWVPFTEVTTTNAAFTTLFSLSFYVPLWADELNLSLIADFEIKTTAGTATYRIQDNATTTNSDEKTTTGAAYARSGAITLVLGAWGGTYRTINVQGKTTAGTCYARSTGIVAWRFSD